MRDVNFHSRLPNLADDGRTIPLFCEVINVFFEDSDQEWETPSGQINAPRSPNHTSATVAGLSVKSDLTNDIRTVKREHIAFDSRL